MLHSLLYDKSTTNQSSVVRAFQDYQIYQRKLVQKDHIIVVCYKNNHKSATFCSNNHFRLIL